MATVRQRILVFCAVLLPAACSTAPLQPIHPAPTADAPTVVIFKSSDNPLLTGPAQAFREQMKDTARLFVVTAEGDTTAILDSVAEAQPDLVFALGAKAARAIRQHLPQTPLLFAMVVNYRRLEELQGPGVMGVSLETPVVSEFTQFKMVMPKMKKVLAFYSPQTSQRRVEENKETLKGLGIELNAISVDSSAQVAELYPKHKAGHDTIWFMNDPIVMNPKTFSFLRDHALADRLAFVSSLSDRFARDGALMSVSVDFSSIGFQAAAMARRALGEAESMEAIGVQPPISANLVLNLSVAQSIGVEVPQDVLPFINEVLITDSDPGKAQSPASSILGSDS